MSSIDQAMVLLGSIEPEDKIARVDYQLPHPIMAYDVDPQTGERKSQPYRQWDLPDGPWVVVTLQSGAEYAIWKITGELYRVGPDGAVDEDPVTLTPVQVVQRIILEVMENQEGVVPNRSEWPDVALGYAQRIIRTLGGVPE